jgi:hypothetical protein
VNFCKLFLKIFSVLTGKAGGFIDLKVYKKNGGWKFLSSPIILKGFLRRKTQNFAVK